MLDRLTPSGRRTFVLLGTGILAIIVLVALALPFWNGYIRQRDMTRAAATFPTPPVPQAGTPIEPPRPLTDWTLTSHTGQPLHLSDLRGKAVLLFFGYTSCPDVCPTTLADFADVKRALGSAGDELAVVFVSVDSQRDTPEKLSRYVTAFDPAFIGATGDDATLQTMGKEYGLYFARQEATGTNAGYLVDHTSASYLIDAEGRERMIYSFNTPPTVIAKDLQAVIQNR